MTFTPPSEFSDLSVALATDGVPPDTAKINWLDGVNGTTAFFSD
jgi:hypothetical protein